MAQHEEQYSVETQQRWRQEVNALQKSWAQRRAANPGKEFKEEEKTEFAAFLKKQNEEAQRELAPRIEQAKKSTPASGGKSAEERGKEAGDTIAEAGNGALLTMQKGMATTLGLGEDFVDSVKENGLYGAGKKAGKGVWEWFSGLFEDIGEGDGSGWKKLLGMAGGGLLAWLASSMFGGGWLGTVIFALLAIPFALMGRNFVAGLGSGDSDAGKSRDEPERGRGQSREVSADAPTRDTRVAMGGVNTTSIGSVQTPGEDQPNSRVQYYSAVLHGMDPQPRLAYSNVDRAQPQMPLPAGSGQLWQPAPESARAPA